MYTESATILLYNACRDVFYVRYFLLFIFICGGVEGRGDYVNIYAAISYLFGHFLYLFRLCVDVSIFGSYLNKDICNIHHRDTFFSLIGIYFIFSNFVLCHSGENNNLKFLSKNTPKF